jgi:hypothetical protein
MNFGLMISIGDESGGFHYTKGWARRLCLGRICFTWLPIDGDHVMHMASMHDIHRNALGAARRALADEVAFRERDRRPPAPEDELEAEVSIEQMQEALGKVERALWGEGADG